MKKNDLIKLSPGELTDLGVCPTCLDREENGVIYGQSSHLITYEDDDIECLFISNPRSEGHMIISTKEHFNDMADASDKINKKIIVFAKEYMKIIKEVFGCEKVYYCTMCDGPANHYHVQLIPRYSFEKRGSKNFVKPRKKYVDHREKTEEVKRKITIFAQKKGIN